MKAAIATQYGPPEVVEIHDRPMPTPTDDELLVKIHASTVAIADHRMRAFDVPPAFWLPGRLALGIFKPRTAVLGREFAGEVVKVGRNVKGYKVGDRIFGLPSLHGDGCHAEYRAMRPSEYITHIPDNVSYQDAAALPFGGLTALTFLQHAQLRAGQTILINGASGSVGTYAVQLAKHFGATVTAVCSTRNVELVQALGADRVIDYTTADFTQCGEQFDVVFEVVGTRTFAELKHLVKPNGVLLHAVMVMAGIKAPYFKRQTGITVVGDTPPIFPNAINTLADLMSQGIIRAVIDRSFTLDEIVEAHRLVSSKHKRGAALVTIVPPHES